MKTNQEARQALMQTSSNAILSVGFGLQAQKSVGREDKMIGTGVQIALKRVRFFVGPDPQIPRKCSLQRIIYTQLCVHTSLFSFQPTWQALSTEVVRTYVTWGSMFRKDCSTLRAGQRYDTCYHYKK